MITHARHQSSIVNTSEDMSQVTVFVTDKQTDKITGVKKKGKLKNCGFPAYLHTQVICQIMT